MDVTLRVLFVALTMGRALLLSLLVSAACFTFADLDIQVNGLFPGQAVMTINGTLRILKVGQTSPEGVTLLESDSQQAVVEIAGKHRTLALSERISSTYNSAAAAEVRIPRGVGGHYFVGGNINGHSVQFMVDTGATTIAMNYLEAERLGVDFRSSRQGVANTAGGVVQTLYVILPKVTVGAITLHHIPAAVVVGSHPQQILLGNSFLSRVSMIEEQGVMVLRKLQ